MWTEVKREMLNQAFSYSPWSNFLLLLGGGKQASFATPKNIAAGPNQIPQELQGREHPKMVCSPHFGDGQQITNEF